MSSQPRKPTHRKLSISSTSSAETSQQRFNSQPAREIPSSSQWTNGRSDYPVLAKRQSQGSSKTENDVFIEETDIDTESRIVILSPRPTSSIDGLSSISSYEEDQTRRNLMLISKYTTQSQAEDFNSSSSLIRKAPAPNPTNQTVNRSKNKRCLSPLNEMDGTQSDKKRTSSVLIDDEEDNDEVLQLLDHRKSKLSFSQNENTKRKMSMRSQSKTSTRKTNPPKMATRQQPKRNSMSYVEHSNFDDMDNNSDLLILGSDDSSDTDPKMKSSKKSSTRSTIDDNSRSSRDPSSSTPLKKLGDYSTMATTDEGNFIQPRTMPVHCQTPPSSSYQNMANDSFNDFIIVHSPCEFVHEKKVSSPSSSFDTPCSSVSRIILHQNTSKSNSINRTVDAETSMSPLSKNELMKNLVSKTNLNVSQQSGPIDFDPIEVARQCFETCRVNVIAKKSDNQKTFICFDRYEIEIRHGKEDSMSSKVYACDRCLKYFHGSALASQRHSSKCLQMFPPGRLIFADEDLAVFCIGEKEMNQQQRIYVNGLLRLARFFLDPEKSIDDAATDRFVYYVLCRRDPVLHVSQTFLYRFVGYFSRHSEQSSINLSCLFILPPFAHRQEFHQLLLTLSYYLTQSSDSKLIRYSSPARPLDRVTFSNVIQYWRDTILFHLGQIDGSSIDLDVLERRTLIHRRDILFTLYFYGFVFLNPLENSSIYVVKSDNQSNTCFFDRYYKKILEFDCRKSIRSEVNNDETETVVLD